MSRVVDGVHGHLQGRCLPAALSATPDHQASITGAVSLTRESRSAPSAPLFPHQPLGPLAATAPPSPASPGPRCPARGSYPSPTQLGHPAAIPSPSLPRACDRPQGPPPQANMNTEEQGQAVQEGLPRSSQHNPGPQLGCALDRVQKKAVTPGSPTLQTLPPSAAQASSETWPPAVQHLGVPCAQSAAACLTTMVCPCRCPGAEVENSSASSPMCSSTGNIGTQSIAWAQAHSPSGTSKGGS